MCVCVCERVDYTIDSSGSIESCMISTGVHTQVQNNNCVTEVSILGYCIISINNVFVCLSYDLFYHIPSGLVIAEIMRRFVWNFFRVEFAHVLASEQD